MSSLVPMAEYERVEAERDTLRAQIAALEAEKRTINMEVSLIIERERERIIAFLFDDNSPVCINHCYHEEEVRQALQR